MNDVEVLEVFALFYRRCDERDWMRLSDQRTWQRFLRSVQQSSGPASSTGNLLKIPVSLKTPPTYREFRNFADSHFVGGLFSSVVAVESLYRAWTSLPDRQLVFDSLQGFYDSDSAAHMRYLYKSLGIDVAAHSLLPPDHLSLLLSFLGLLLENARPRDIHTFIDEHLDWIGNLLHTIRACQNPPDWMIAITELLIAYLENIKNRVLVRVR